MKIGILGSGQVAQALGNGFLHYGHDVMLGTSDVTKLKEWSDNAGSNAKLGSFLDQLRLKSLFVLVPLRHLVRRHFGLDEIGGDFFQHFLVFSK